MALVDDVASVLPEFRAQAELLMTSTCTITRDGGEPTWDEGTGEYTPATPAIVYVGRCKVQDNSRSVNKVLSGEIRAGINPLDLHLPISGTGGVRRGDVVTIDANPDDPALVGARFVVQAPPAGTAKTARRLPVEAVA